MKLSDLIDDPRAGGPEISGLTADSRAVKPGFLFAALPGTATDGRRFIPDALARGAVAILIPSDGDVPSAPGAAIIVDANPRQRLALLAARFYGRQPSVIAAVTGTNGKTSVAGFTRQIWAKLGLASASLGTLGVDTPFGHLPLSHTTPDPVELHQKLDVLAEKGVTHLAMEASSHGLAQYRLDGVTLAAAGFTNLTRDHLDYHPTFEDYRDAKARLFTELLPRDGLAVVNADGAGAEFFAEIAGTRGLRLMTAGARGKDLRLLAQTPKMDGQTITLEIAGRKREFHFPLPGRFQVENALVAAGLVIGLGGAVDAVIEALAHLTGAPGRLEAAGATPTGARVYVDYAHTPDAVETVLAAVRPHVTGRLHIIIGCGGDRDPGKRPLMGRAAARLADHVIVTDDNPRSEDPARIREAVLDGAPAAEEIADRAEAIKSGIAALGAGDILVIAGKGHEEGQIVAGIVHPFNDLLVARAALREMGGRA
ncbi:MAG: UDP-N-acetylmuramoyl-L-alanyl-D-glutamate--2,6-diaminopimelate ligase [Alphaproteobacteria bacterium]|nr:UDP-N-acetylmuramoyl-L-alanyl-D-glutamate--2,6-diaminopimelate ligase [Alphaproteobacteria bacterium]